MAVLSWGKPKVEFVVAVNGTVPATPTWIQAPIIVDKTAQLTSVKGNVIEALGEGGELVDKRTDKNKYTFEFEVFVKKGDTRPITDEDGIITDRYAVRLTPEDATTEGFQMNHCSVTVEETWSSEQGKRLKYSFAGLKPATGNILIPYTQA